jgi:hypothetical protein
MTQYNVFDQSGKPVGHTTSPTELAQFLRTHKGYTSSPELVDGSHSPHSTLPKIQEDRPTPEGGLLQQ